MLTHQTGFVCSRTSIIGIDKLSTLDLDEFFFGSCALSHVPATCITGTSNVTTFSSALHKSKRRARPSVISLSSRYLSLGHPDTFQQPKESHIATTPTLRSGTSCPSPPHKDQHQSMRLAQQLHRVLAGVVVEVYYAPCRPRLRRTLCTNISTNHRSSMRRTTYRIIAHSPVLVGQLRQARPHTVPNHLLAAM
jgi:hypothetical protein